MLIMRENPIVVYLYHEIICSKTKNLLIFKRFDASFKKIFVAGAGFEPAASGL